MEVKQVIVIRKDLKMRRGKEIAQGAHASIKWLVDRVSYYAEQDEPPHLSVEERAWVDGSFTKVCLQVEDEKTLWDVYRAAEKAGLTVSLITDAGRTEFNGVPTKTCLAIGPDRADRIDPITQDLKLY